MNERRFPARVNVKALVILVALVLAIGGGGAIAYKIRKRVMADRALAAGKAALENEDWGKACTKLRFYLSKYPDDEEILADYAEANLAVRPRDAGHIGAAIGAYRRMLRHRPGDAETSRQLAKLYFLIGDYNEAAYICRQRIEAEADDPEVLLLLGRALVGLRQHDESRVPLGRLVELANKHANQVKAYGLLADLELQEDGAAAANNAVKWLDEAVEAHPESAEAWLMLAESLGFRCCETPRPPPLFNSRLKKFCWPTVPRSIPLEIRPP